MSAVPDCALTAAEFDLVLADLGLGRPPFPLEVPSRGATAAERAELTAAAYRSLAERGLATGGRLHERPAELLRLLAAPAVSIDVVGHAGGPFRALAAADSRQAVLARIDADELQLTEIRPTALARAAVDVLPPGEPGPARTPQPFRRELLERVLSEDDEVADPFGGDLDDETALERAGMPAADAAALVELAEDRRGGGQFGVSRGPVRASTLVTWFDTGGGRYLMTTENAWISIAPADDARIAQRLADVLSAA